MIAQTGRENPNGSGGARISMTWFVTGFWEAPSNWSEIPIPTEAQFFGLRFVDRYPYVADEVRFLFETVGAQGLASAPVDL